MREKRYGKIVNISSVGGKAYTLFGGWYHATKHALEGFSDCLRLEIADFGIDVIVIEPGGIKTQWGAIAAANLRKTSANGTYEEQARRTADRMEDMYTSNQLSPSTLIAKVILKAVRANKPKTRYAVGYMAKPAMFLRKYISDRMFDAMVKRMM